MKHPLPRRFPSAAAFQEHLGSIDPAFRCDLESEGADGPLGEPLEVLGHRLANRFAIHPMEGWDGTREGGPSEATLRRWHNFGESGAALIWGGEAVAVTADGRANGNQLCTTAGADPRATLAALRGAIDRGVEAAGAEGCTPLVGLQLTHSGRFARPDDQPAPRPATRHPLLDGRLEQPLPELLTDGELQEIGAAYVHAAELAAEAGFAFVDIKACHGYLLHELLGGQGRPGPYGGDLAGRSRLLFEIIDGVRAAVPQLGVAVRLSAGDVFPHRLDPATGAGAPLGWSNELPWQHGFGLDPQDPRRFDVQEAITLCSQLAERDVTLLNITFGSPYWCPHVQRPAAYPPVDGYPPPEDPLHGVFEQLRLVRELRPHLPGATLVGSGYSYLQEYLPHVAQHEVRSGHVDLVGLGRMALVYHDLPRDVLFRRGLQTRRLCRTFSDCTNAPRNGLRSGCYPLDPYYRDHPDHEDLKQAKQRSRETSTRRA